MEKEPYGKRLHKAARQDFRKYWSNHRRWATFTTLASPIVLAVLTAWGWRWLRSSGMLSATEVVLSGLAGLSASLVGHYVIALRNGAEALDTELRRTVASLRRPERTAVEQRHYDEALSALERLGIEGADMLRFLRKHGTIQVSGSGWPVLPDGMAVREMVHILNLCVKESLATKTTSGQYSIAPGMRTALDELLYPLKNSATQL